MTAIFVDSIHSTPIPQTASTNETLALHEAIPVSKWENVREIWVCRGAARARALAPTLLGGEFFFGGVVRFYVVFQDLDELGDDLVAFQRGEQAAVHIDRRFRFLEGSRQ